MAAVNLKTRSGNRCLAFIDGKQIGLMQSVRMSDDYAPEPASGIGDIHVVEHVPTMARHSVNVTNMVLNKNAMRESGTPGMINGDDMLRGLVFDIDVVSKDDGKLLRKYSGCSYASGDMEVTKHAIVMGNAVFNAIDVVGDGG